MGNQWIRIYFFINSAFFGSLMLLLAKQSESEGAKFAHWNII